MAAPHFSLCFLQKRPGGPVSLKPCPSPQWRNAGRAAPRTPEALGGMGQARAHRWAACPPASGPTGWEPPPQAAPHPGSGAKSCQPPGSAPGPLPAACLPCSHDLEVTRRPRGSSPASLGLRGSLPACVTHSPGGWVSLAPPRPPAGPVAVAGWQRSEPKGTDLGSSCVWLSSWTSVPMQAFEVSPAQHPQGH